MASVIGQGSVEQVADLSLASDTAVESKVCAMVALSREIASYGGAAGESATALIQAELTKAVARETDVDFISRVTASVIRSRRQASAPLAQDAT
jgi:hypothetical protein